MCRLLSAVFILEAEAKAFFFFTIQILPTSALGFGFLFCDPGCSVGPSLLPGPSDVYLVPEKDSETEGLWLGIKSELQVPAYATATAMRDSPTHAEQHRNSLNS